MRIATYGFLAGNISSVNGIMKKEAKYRLLSNVDIGTYQSTVITLL